MGHHEEDAVDQWLQTPIPETLWHYTSTAGFQGIVTSKEVFATDVRFLNDLEEYVHGLKLAREVAASFPEEDDNGWKSRDRLVDLVEHAFSEGSLSESKLQLFAASFSTSRDELSQWRGYSHGSSGVSLGFDLHHLRPQRTSETLVAFAPCIYDNEIKRNLMRNALERFAKEASDLWRMAGDSLEMRQLVAEHTLANPDSTPEQVAQGVKHDLNITITSRMRFASVRALTALLSLAALMKNRAFSEEREWRLILPVSPDHKSPTLRRSFRVTTNFLVPYIGQTLLRNDRIFPLRKVILGPGSPKNSLLAATSFLRVQELDIVPTLSDVPFRPT
jgi:hypothetical protein